jgi:transposase
MELTDGQWELLRPLVEPKTPSKRRGRPWRDTRQVLEGVLWILRTGAQWAELPQDKFPPYQTCHRRFQSWVREGTLVQILRALAEDLLARGQLDLSETFIDASFSSAKKGGVQLVQHAAARGPRLRTAVVFLSPWGLQALRRMKPGWSSPLSNHASRRRGPDA